MSPISEAPKLRSDRWPTGRLTDGRADSLHFVLHKREFTSTVVGRCCLYGKRHYECSEGVLLNSIEVAFTPKISSPLYQEKGHCTE